MGAHGHLAPSYHLLLLDLADLTVDGTMCTGGAACIMLMTNGVNVWVALLCAFIAGMIAGAITGLLHTAMGIPAILAGILTQLALFSINLRIMGGKANQAINPDNYDLLVSPCYECKDSVWKPHPGDIKLRGFSLLCSTGSLERSWAAASGPPAPTLT